VIDWFIVYDTCAAFRGRRAARADVFPIVHKHSHIIEQTNMLAHMFFLNITHVMAVRARDQTRALVFTASASARQRATTNTNTTNTNTLHMFLLRNNVMICMWMRTATSARLQLPDTRDCVSELSRFERAAPCPPTSAHAHARAIAASCLHTLACGLPCGLGTNTDTRNGLRRPLSTSTEHDLRHNIDTT